MLGSLEMSFNERLGEHLRALRKHKGLSLADVQAASSGEFRISVLGAYERGERAITVARLARLAELYHLPLADMLPVRERRAEEEPATLRVDVRRLEATASVETRAVGRCVKALQERRAGFASNVVTIRGEDVRVIAATLGTTPAALGRRLEELGVLAW